MKNLVIFVDSLKRDGAERVSVNLAHYMSKNNIKTTLLTEWISENEYDCPKNVSRLSLNSNKNKYLKFVYNIIKMRKTLKKIKPDTMLIMDLPGCLLAIPSALGLNIKIIVSERNDPTHFPGKKIVARLSRWLMSKADGFIFQTKEAMDFYKEITHNRGVVIPNPIFVSELPEVYRGKRKRIIATAGRLTEQKNQKMLIDAFYECNKTLPDYHLYVYGEGHLKDDLIEYTKVLGLQNKILFPGNSKTLLDDIKDISLFVMTSNFEGMPNALLEAMALGLPCISTDCPIGGPRAVINNYSNGILIGVNDIKSCTKEMINLLSNRDFAQKIGENALLIRKSLDHRIICRKWLDYLESI